MVLFALACAELSVLISQISLALACVHGNADCISATYHNLPIVWVSLIRIQLKCFSLSRCLPVVSVVSASAGCWFRRSLAYRISLNFCYLLSLRVAHGPSFLFLFSCNHIHCIACIVAHRVAHGPSFLFLCLHIFSFMFLRFALFFLLFLSLSLLLCFCRFSAFSLPQGALGPGVR